jgi:hypothetical protein
MEGHSLLANYHEQPRVWDEMFTSGGIRPPYQNFVSAIQNLSADEMTHKDELAILFPAFLKQLNGNILKLVLNNG